MVIYPDIILILGVMYYKLKSQPRSQKWICIGVHYGDPIIGYEVYIPVSHYLEGLIGSKGMVMAINEYILNEKLGVLIDKLN
jgi:hypothetical protein